MSGKRDFLSMPAPENYVAGLGRGATGFTTRSDLGPAREGPSEEQMKEMLAKRAAQLGQAAPSAYGAVEKKEEDEDDDRYADPDSEVGLFSSGVNHTEDDDEADRIYQEVDEKMDKRRRARREAREQKEREEYERNNPKIQQQFADLKRALGAVSEEEWAALPEVGDMTGRTKRAREARQAASRFYAVPDSVIAAGAQAGQYETSISADSGDGTMTNFASIGAAQKSALQVRLDSAASNAATAPGTQTVSGTSTSVDPRGYITALDKAQTVEAGAPVEDINRARVLLESAVKTNLHNGPGHVALCRLEEVAGKIHTAKKVIARGCELCPHSIVCWVENIRINRDNIHNAKIIAAQAIKLNPKAIDLWKAAIDLEQTVGARKKVTRQALDHNPQSVDLWKILINDTEEIENVRLLFAKAVDTVKLSEELWISYARVSDPDHAQQILNAARKAIPTSWAIWIQACRLQEQLGNNGLLDKLMERAVKALVKENAMLKREEWIAQAEICEEEGAEMTSAAIIKSTIGWGLDEDDDRKEIWLQDSRDSIGRGKYSTARAIISHCLRVFPRSKTAWHAAADLEKKHGTTEDLLALLDRAVAEDACPTSESLWLQYAHEAWASGDKDGARQILGRAFRATDSAETVYTRAVQLEVDDKEYEKARGLLEQAREARPTDRVYMKSAVLERQLGNLDRALDLVNQGINTWPASWKLHAIKGQLYESMGKLKEAQEALTAGTRANSKAVPLFILLSRIQERTGLVVKARSTLDRARQNNPKNAEVWCEAVRLERRAGNMPAANQLMSIALQECPRSGLLWSEKIMHLEARTHRKPRAVEAIKKVENDPQLFITAARIFWSERKLDKADSWFTKAIVLDADYGDGWAWYYKFLEMHGTEEKKGEVLSRVTQAEPTHGEVWQTVNKDPKNMGKSVEEILKQVVAKLE